MQPNKGWRIWNIVFPVLLYFLASNLWMLALTSFIPYSDENYMILQTMGTCFTLPILVGIYRKDMICTTCTRVQGKKIRQLLTWNAWIRAMILIITAIGASIILNDIIAMTGLLENSISYQQTADKFYGGKLFWEIAGTCVMAPLAEEILYRGIVYQRIRNWHGKNIATVVSALIFGAMHMNVVQFVYAVFMGVMLAYFLEETGKLFCAVLGHMSANLFSVFRTETQCLHQIEQNSTLHFLFLFVMLIGTLAGMYMLKLFYKDKL